MSRAVKELKPRVPIVVRLTGTNEKEAKVILQEVELPVRREMEEVVNQAIELANKAA